MIKPDRVIRSGRKTLALQISPQGELIVRAPRRCPQARIDEMIASHQGWIARHKAMQQNRRAAHPEPTEEERRALLQRAKEELPRRVAHFAEIMGLCPAGVTITGARTRFGSCSAKNRLCFSWRLMAYPAEAVDYVVVHELAHLVHKNHGPDFYALVARYLPDYKERQRLLKE